MASEEQRVVVGMDPHERSVTIEVMDAEEQTLGGGRFTTDVAGHRSMLDHLRRSRAAAGLGGRSPFGCWLTVKRSWMSQ
jgi:hypothetical protein